MSVRRRIPKVRHPGVGIERQDAEGQPPQRNDKRCREDVVFQYGQDPLLEDAKVLEKKRELDERCKPATGS